MTAPGLTKDGIARTINGVAVTTACATECCEDSLQGHILTLCVCDEGSPPAADYYIAEGTDPLPSVIRVGASSGFPFCYTVAESLSDVTGLTEVESYESIDSCDECCPPPCCESVNCTFPFDCWWIEKLIASVWTPQITVTSAWEYTFDFRCCPNFSNQPPLPQCPNITRSGGGALTFSTASSAPEGQYIVGRCNIGGITTIDSTTRLVCGCITGSDGRSRAFDIASSNSCLPNADRNVETGYITTATTCEETNSVSSSHGRISFFGPVGCFGGVDQATPKINTVTNCRSAIETLERERINNGCVTSSGTITITTIDFTGSLELTIGNVYDCEAPEMVMAMLSEGASTESILTALAARARRRTARITESTRLPDIDTIDAEVPWLI